MSATDAPIKVQWFDHHGWLTEQLPSDCVLECSAAGAVDEAVAYWIKELDFDVPEPQAARWLKEFGAWDEEELANHDDNVQRVLWLACCDIKENGEWFGLVH